MKTDSGTVVACDGSVVTVALHSRDECASCALGKICTVNRNPGAAIIVSTDLDVVPGNRVEVSIDDSLFLKVSVIMYGVPLMAFLAGVFGGYALSLIPGFPAMLAAAIPVVFGFIALAIGVAISLPMARKLNMTGRITKVFREEATRHT